jgi:hypothetical protein
VNPEPQACLPGLLPEPSDDPDSRFTLRHTLDWCKRAAGVEEFDLDVAACEEAHVCPRFYTIRDDGLALPWFGRVWCNPSFSAIEPWVIKAWDEWNTGHCVRIAMLLPANRTEQPWWHVHVETWRDRSTLTPLRTHFLPGRQSFGRPGNPLGVGVGSPEFGCVLLVWR